MQQCLIPIERTHKDVVFTFDYVAREIVDLFKPTGSILEPAKGDGAFLKFLPTTAEWCEVREGRDFFSWDKKVDWIISNPPYSCFAEWMRHSMEIADNIVYVVPTNKTFNSYKLFEQIYTWGGIHTIYHLGAGREVCENQELGFAFSATYYKRGWQGGITVLIKQRPNK